jgi:Family of unknown function (DUF6941)
MEVGFLLLTDHSESLNGKLYAMGGGWNMLRFSELPTEHVFGIGFGVDVGWDEANQRHTITLETQDPDGERLGDELELEIEVGRPPGSVTGQDQRVVISIQATAVFSTSGPHAVVIRDGEREIGRSRFYVAEPPEQSDPLA